MAGPTDPRNSNDIGAFLETILPNVYFALFDVQQALKQENQPRPINCRLKVPPDIELLKVIAQRQINTFDIFTISNIIKDVSENRERLADTWRRSNQRLADRINEIRRDKDFVKKAKNFAGHPSQLPTLAVIQELIRPIFLDDTLPINCNDAGDIHHAIGSIAYCDFALLDGKWEDLRTRMKRQFTKLEIKIPTAAVFSKRRRGITRFLEALETATMPPNTEGNIIDIRQ